MAAKEIIYFPFRAQVTLPMPSLIRFCPSSPRRSSLTVSRLQLYTSKRPRAGLGLLRHGRSGIVWRQCMQTLHMFAVFAAIAFVAAICCMKY
jgi:hypothetical protein